MKSLIYCNMDGSRYSFPDLMRVGFLWHGLPFYACHSLVALRERIDPKHLFVGATVAKGSIFGTEEARQLDVRWLDPEVATRFGRLGEEVPDLLFKTSWHHPVFESLADEVRASGGRVVIMADNIFELTPRKCLGILYARLCIRRKHWGVLVPGKRASRFMGAFGFPKPRIFQSLYCTNERCFRTSTRRINRILFVGRFEPEKNVEALVSAWRRYKNAGGRIEELLLIGSGSLAITSDCSIGLKVQDWAPQPEVAGAMSESAFFILPSKRDHWGVVLLEAALSGCVLLASVRCGATADLIENGTNGNVINDASADGIFKVMRWADEFQLQENAMLEAATYSRMVGERFRVQAFCDSVEAIAREVILEKESVSLFPRKPSRF